MELLCPLILSMAIGLHFELEELHIEGIQAFPRDEVEEILEFEKGDTLSEKEITYAVDQLLEEYRDAGYLKAKLTWWMEYETVYLQIEEGPRFTLGRIELKGNRFFSGDYILSNFELKEGRIFSQSLLERDIEGLLTRYEDNGFPFCTVKPSNFRLDEVLNQISFILKIDEGSLTRIGDVEIDGNDHTKDWIILRELGIREDEIYSRKQIENAIKRLDRLGLIEVIHHELGMLRDGWVIIKIKIDEKPFNSVEGVIGWVPKEEELTGLVNLRADNLFGTLRSFHFQWTRREPLSSYLRFRYREPWLFGAPLSGELDTEAVIEDTSYTVHSASVHFFSEIFDPFFLGIGVGVDRVTALKAPMPNSNQISLTLHSGVDTRDSHYTPRKGMFYRLSTKFGVKSDYSSSQFQEESVQKSYVRKTQFKLLNFVPIRKGVLYTVIGGGKLTAKGSSSAWEEFKLGGATTVRGYREEQFVAPQVGWLNLEYRFIIDRSGWISPFFDFGHYKNRRAGWIYGWGLGVGLTSRLGLITIYYGLGREDSLGSGKMHFGLLTEF